MIARMPTPVRQKINSTLGKSICRCQDWQVDAIRQALETSERELWEIAHELGYRSEAILRDYSTSPADRNGHHRCLHASNVVPLCRASRNVVLLEAMLGEMGFGMPLPQDGGNTTATQLIHTALVGMGELLSQAAKDTADGNVDACELVGELPLLHALRDTLDELIVAGEKLRRNGRGERE